MKKEENVTKGTKIFSKILTVVIIFLVLICMILFFKTVTNSEVSLFGLRFYYVATESMYPTIKPNSLIVVKDVDPDTLEIGDIISFKSRDKSIYGMINTHRIIEIIDNDEEKAFMVMGDNNPTPDADLVYPDEIVGKVVAHTPPIEALANIFSFAGTSTGFFVVIILPLSFILILIFGSFFKTLRENLKEQEDEAKEKAKIYEKQTQELEEKVFSIVDVNPGPEQSKQAAIIILEQFFGKKISEITEEDIEKKIKEKN